MSDENLDRETIQKTPWHALSVADCLQRLQTRRDEGLDEEDVQKRRQRFGANKLPEKKPDSLALVFVKQFGDPLIYVLLAAGAVSLAIGHYSDAIFIFAVLAFNAILGTIQEYKAQTSARSLQEVIQQRARVHRSGRTHEIDAAELVPGDIVRLVSGAAIPADIRVITSRELRVDESLLTGESLPVEKNPEADVAEEAPVSDRQSMVYGGTVVTDGRATGVVCATATDTEVGLIAESLAEESAEPPLVTRMRRLTRLIAIFILVAVFLVGTVQLLTGTSLTETFLLAVALAVSAIPAGLPVAVTVALAVASHRMAKRHVIVRHLPAVEGLGSCTAICSDKTGTLTENRLRASRLYLPQRGVLALDTEEEGEERLVFAADGEGLPDDEDRRLVNRLAVAGMLANEAEPAGGADDGDNGAAAAASGDTVDIAFLAFGETLGLDPGDVRRRHQQVGEIPYSSDRRYGASFNRFNGGVAVQVKGAVETLVEMSGFADDEKRAAVLRQADRLAGEGMRVLGVAAGEIDDEDKAREGDETLLRDLEFLGLVGLFDPLRREVPGAVERCHQAGVSVRMVTGDHPATAATIGRRLAISEADEEPMTGAELVAAVGERAEGAGDNGERVLNTRIFARVEPAQKTRLVEFLQEHGHFVAVTGDGVNDAPALNSAHIGVAMGQMGTDVARRAAKLILGDDNFASIVNGIEEGRIAYDNVRKVVWLLLSTSLAELVLFALALAMGMKIPLFAAQLLWLNLVTNGIQDVALAFEGKEPNILRRPPRNPREPIINRRMVEQVVLTGTWMGTVAFGVYWYLVAIMEVELAAARNLVLLLMVLFENAHIFNCRSEYRSVFAISPGSNWLLIATVVAAQTVHIGSMWVPGLSVVLGTAPVSWTAWLVLLGIALTVIVVVEGYKWLRHGAEGP